MRKQFIFFISLLLAFSLLLAGCAGSKTKDPTGGSKLPAENDPSAGKTNQTKASDYDEKVFKIEEGEANFDASGAKADPAVKAAGEKLADAIRQSGNKVISEIDEDNFVFSPLSFYFAYAALYNGANGEGAEELKQLLTGASDLDIDMLNKASGVLIRELTNIKDFKMDVNTLLAGKIDYEFAADFLQAAADYYEAVGVKMDFSKSEAVDALNNWTKEKTNGLIDPLFPEGYSFSPETAMVLINTVYLLAEWQESFDPNLTAKRDFNGLDKTTEVEMMENRFFMNYAATDDYQLVSLNYKGGAKMNLYLPTKGTAPQDILLSDRNDVTEVTDIQLSLPKFDMESDIGLVEVLEKLTPSILASGSLQELMTSNGAAVTDLFVSSSFQKARIKVDEDGTEAAAATVIAIEESMALIDGEDYYLVIIFDRPFAWEIVYDNVPLFTGVVSNLP
jgi:serpin B